MFDLKFIRENSERFDTGWGKRGMPPQTPQILALDEKRRMLQTELQELQARQNEASKKIGQVKALGGDASSILAEVASYKDRLILLEEEEKKHADILNQILETLPNVPDASVPEGRDAADNQEVRTFGDPKSITRRLKSALDHVAIGEGLGGMDFETAAKISGARFVILRGAVARLERALSQFMLDIHTREYGYTEMSVPLLVRDDALYGTGQLPKFSEDLFKATSGHWLIPTSEVVLTNIVRDSILDAADLPLRFTALTPCFRSEAGAAGKDTRGMIRQHQFNKVELVSIASEHESMSELERMTECAESILKRLEIPFRTLLLCGGDMGFAALKTYDIEAWLPGQEAYREISSCSNCGDFQARRMMARCREEGAGKRLKYVHTLNGSGLAVGRCLIAVLENYQQLDGSVIIPEVLVPYMGGILRIEPPEGRERDAAKDGKDKAARG